MPQKKVGLEHSTRLILRRYNSCLPREVKSFRMIRSKAMSSMARRSVSVPKDTELTPDIIKGTPEQSKADLEALVYKNGGQFVQSQLADGSAMVIAPDRKSENGYARRVSNI